MVLKSLPAMIFGREQSKHNSAGDTDTVEQKLQQLHIWLSAGTSSPGPAAERLGPQRQESDTTSLSPTCADEPCANRGLAFTLASTEMTTMPWESPAG